MAFKTLGDLKRGSLVKKGTGIDVSPAILGMRMASPASATNQRKKACENDLEQFCRVYLRKHFTKGFGDMHYDLFDACNGPSPHADKGKRVARIAPRKFGKTTIISLALPLWHLAYKRKYFILLIGEASGTAEANLATIVEEVETNELLLEDFPHLRPARDAKGQLEKWTDRQITFASGATVLAKGTGARMRGLKKGSRRPDLAILDDPESPETADTFLKRIRHKKWFGGTFMGLGDDTWDVFVIGNLPHRDCLIASLVGSKEWDGLLWRAINTLRKEERLPIGNVLNDGSALWPEGWSLERLAAYKREPEVGALNFAREMMNDPRVEEEKTFDPLKFQYVEWTRERLKEYEEIVTVIDPAGGTKAGEFKKGKRDYAAIVTGGRLSDGWIEIFGVVMTKKTPDYQIKRLLDQYERFDSKLACEENMYKNLLAPTIMEAAKKRKLYPTITAHEQHGAQNKMTRIIGIQPQVADPSTRVVRFARHLVETVPTYFAQFDEFPGDWDDGPDATEQLIKQLEKRMVYGQLGGPTGTSYWRSSSAQAG